MLSVTIHSLELVALINPLSSLARVFKMRSHPAQLLEESHCWLTTSAIPRVNLGGEGRRNYEVRALCLESLALLG